MAGLPSAVGGTVISKTPYSFFFIGWVLLSHLSKNVRMRFSHHLGVQLTEVADKRSLNGVGSPLPVDNATVLLHPQSKEFSPLAQVSRWEDRG